MTAAETLCGDPDCCGSEIMDFAYIYEYNDLITLEDYRYKIIGHEPTGFDYLMVLVQMKVPTELQFGDSIMRVRLTGDTYSYIDFNLTGSPLDEKNAKKFVELVTK
jgi:hypothetical protein